MRTAPSQSSRLRTARLAISLAGCVALATATPAYPSEQGAGGGAESTNTAQAVPGDPESLAPLIGEWEVGPPGEPPSFVETFAWGPNHAYVWSRVVLLRAPGDEHLHLEGIVIWNASTQGFDYLFAVEPGSLTQERGEFRVEADGRIIRDVVLIDGKGRTSRFRQSFLRLGEDRFQTTLMRQAADDWAPTFPGSDNLTMVRRSR